MKKIIGLAGDHAGFQLKQQLIPAIENLGFAVKDFGPFDDKGCDFPDFVGPAAAALAAREVHRIILIDGAGYPSGMTANKFPGVYAAVANDIFSAKLCREHSNANALCIGGQVIGLSMAKEIVTLFLNTPFAGGKYARRVEKVKSIESEQLELESTQRPVDILSLEELKEAVRSRKSILMDENTRLTPSAEDFIRSL